MSETFNLYNGRLKIIRILSMFCFIIREDDLSGRIWTLKVVLKKGYCKYKFKYGEKYIIWLKRSLYKIFRNCKKKLKIVLYKNRKTKISHLS